MVEHREYETSEDYPSHLPLEQRLAYLSRKVTGPERTADEQLLPEEQSTKNPDYVESRTVTKTPSGLSQTNNIIPITKNTRTTLKLALLASLGIFIYVHNEKMIDEYSTMFRSLVTALQEGPRVLEDDQFGYHSEKFNLYS